MPVVKWLVTALVIGTVGTVIVWCVMIVIEEVPFWILIVALMVVEVALFKLGAWYIRELD